MSPRAAKLITNELKIPTIGIGSSKYCDGQILVTDDMLGISGFYPKFVKWRSTEVTPTTIHAPDPTDRDAVKSNGLEYEASIKLEFVEFSLIGPASTCLLINFEKIQEHSNSKETS